MLNQIISIIIALAVLDVYFLIIKLFTKLSLKRRCNEIEKLSVEVGVELDKPDIEKTSTMGLKILAGVSVVIGIIISFIFTDSNINTSIYALTRSKILYGLLVFLFCINIRMFFKKFTHTIETVQDIKTVINNDKKNS